MYKICIFSHIVNYQCVPIAFVIIIIVAFTEVLRIQ